MNDTVSSPSIKEKITLKIVLIAIVSCLIFGVISGFRSDFSAVIGIIETAEGSFSYVDLQLANTVCRFVTALSAPFIAFLTLKRSNFFVLTFGFIMTILGLLCIAVATSFPVLFIGLGILFAVGTAALSFGIIFGIVSALVGESVAIVISTLFSISTTFFGVLFTPLIQMVSNLVGYRGMLFLFITLLVCIYPMIFAISGKKKEVSIMKEKENMKFTDALSLIFRDKYTYVLMAFLFIVGFASGITNHFYTGMLSFDFPSMGASFSFSMMKIISAIGMVVMTLLVVHFKRPLRFAALIFFLFGIALVIQLLMSRDDYYFLICVYCAVFVMSALYPLSTQIIRHEYAPILIASVLCFLGIFEKIGAGINSVIGGIIYDAYGTFDLLIFSESGITILFAVVLLLFFIGQRIVEKKKTKK